MLEIILDYQASSYLTQTTDELNINQNAPGEF